MLLSSHSLFSQKEPSAMSQHNDIRLTDIILALSLLVMVALNVASQVASL